MKKIRMMFLAVSMLCFMGTVSAQWTVFDPTQQLGMIKEFAELRRHYNHMKAELDFAKRNYEKLQRVPKFVSDMKQVGECATYVVDIANNLRLGCNDLNAGARYFSSMERLNYIKNFTFMMTAANKELGEMSVVAKGKGGDGSEMNAAERMRLVRDIHDRLATLRERSEYLRRLPNRIIYARTDYVRQNATMRGLLGDKFVAPITMNELKY